MFRKPKGGTKKNKNVRKKADDDDDEEDINDEGTTEFDTGASIRKTMHKQKLLASLPMTTSSLMVNNHNGRGTGATHQSTVVAAGVDTNDTGTGVYIKSRSAYTDTGAPAELSVLEKKHQENMESFISAKVGGGDNDENNTKNHTRKTLLRTTMTDEDLYRQLAQDVTNGGGGEKETTSVTAASPGVGENGDNSNTNERDTEETGVLVGSGIAEVILPTMTRHDSTAGQGNTAAYLSKYQSSAIPAAERHKHAMPDTIPKPLAKFRKQYSTPFQNTHNQDHNNNNTNTNTNTTNPNTTTTTTTNATKEEEAQQTKTDQTRAGFQSFIGKGSVAAATAENQARAAEQQQYNNHNSNPNNNNHNNNKRKWQTGQSRDDQAYAHFLKTAIAGRRMR